MNHHQPLTLVLFNLLVPRETILKNRRTNRLLMELQEERVQRLQDLQEIYAKDKQLELLANEMVRFLFNNNIMVGYIQICTSLIPREFVSRL